MAKKETKVAPTLLTVRALIGASAEPAKGLFIAFKLAAAPPLTRAAKIAHLIDTPHTDLFKDKRYQRLQAQFNAQAAETVADPAEKFVLGITDVDGYLEPVYNSSNPWRDRLTRLEPDSFKFAAGEEYSALLIRHPSPDLARALTRALNGGLLTRDDIDFSHPYWSASSHSSALEKYFSKAQPHLQTIRIEQGSGIDGEQFIVRLPETPDAYVPRFPADPKRWWLYAGMPHESLPSVRQQVRELVDSLGQLKFPATGDQDDPYSVPGVLEAIDKTDKSKSMDAAAKRRRIAALTAAISEFHGPLHATVGRFQEHLAAGRAFRPVNWDEAHKHSSWTSEIGSPVSFPGVDTPRLEQGGVVGPETARQISAWLRNRWVKPPQHLVTIGNGVLMLARGAFAFNAWSELAKVMGCPYGMSSGHSYRQLMAEGGGGAIKNSIHKTGLASDMTGGRQRTSKADWPIRFEAEFRRLKGTIADQEAVLKEKQAALDAVLTQRDLDRQTAATNLAEAQKAQTELLANPKATPRQKNAAAERVRRATNAANSVDKRFESKITRATKDRDKAKNDFDAAQRAALSDTSRMPDRWRMRFRLYGHSTADVFHPNPETRAAEIARLKAGIAAWAGIEWPPTPTTLPDNGGITGGFVRFLKSKYLNNIDSPLLDTWLREQFAPAYAFAQKIVFLDDATLVDRYFRPTITQWRVNFYELDGGSDMAKPHGPTDGDADFPARADAKSWLNLSAVGHGCQMHRIQPHKWETRDRTSFSKDPSKVPPMAFPMDDYLRFQDSLAEAGDIVAAIEDITASHAQAPELAHSKFQIEFHLPTGEKKETAVAETTLPSAIDSPFFKEWRRRIHSMKKERSLPAYVPGSKGVYQPRGAQISVVLNELNPDRQSSLQSVLDLFRSTFPAKRFLIMESGPMVDDELPKGTFFTGAELAAAAGAALARLTAESTAKAAAAAAEAAAEPPKSKKQKKAKKDVPKPPKVNVADWSILVQPVFTKEPVAAGDMLFLPDHIVMLPARENAAHLEWWHFQHHSVKDAGNWSTLLEECGFSRQVMGTPAEGTWDPSGEPVHIGLGYSTGKSSELDSSPWPSLSEIAEPPSNYDTAHDEAVEEELAYIE